MTRADSPLFAHSLAEAYLYLMATPCAACGRGPLSGTAPRPVHRDGRRLHLMMAVSCGGCEARSAITFDLPADAAESTAGDAPLINPTSEPSQIIDVGQWLTLFRSIAEAAGRTRDKKEARRLGIEAAGCLEEALKFYDDDENDLPPPGALFHATSKARFREHPEQFSRRRIIQLRSKLPTIARMREQSDRLDRTSRRRWWKFW